MKIIVKRIPCHDDQIRLQFVDPFYKAFQKNFVCVIAQMQIGDQGNLQSVMSAAAFGRGDIPGCCVEFFGMKKSIKTEKKDQNAGKKAGSCKHQSGMKPGSIGKRRKIEQDADEICNADTDQGIEKCAQPQIADVF